MTIAHRSTDHGESILAAIFALLATAVLILPSTCNKVHGRDQDRFDVTKSARGISPFVQIDTVNPRKDSIDRANAFYKQWQDTATVRSFMDWLYVRASAHDYDALKRDVMQWMQYYASE